LSHAWDPARSTFRSTPPVADETRRDGSDAADAERRGVERPIQPDRFQPGMVVARTRAALPVRALRRAGVDAALPQFSRGHRLHGLSFLAAVGRERRLL